MKLRPRQAIALWALTFGLLIQPASSWGTDRVKGPVSEEGELGGARFLIDIPENWNGGLLMYAHGYAMATQAAPGFQKAMSAVGHKFGLAVAQSIYSRQGWAAEEGILETEALRQYFVDTYGPTHPTIIAGHSQGGFITYATIERHSEHYDGALPLCGVAQPSLQFFKERVFDMRVLFDHYFPGLPGSAVEFPAGRGTFAAVLVKAGQLVKENPEKAEDFARLVDLSGVQAISGTLAFWSEILREMQERAGGNAFDNRDTIYTGIGDDVSLNAGIPRYSADEKAMAYLRKWATLSGEVSDPVLAVHTMVDDLIPLSMTGAYDALTNVAGTQDFFVQQYTTGIGHCAFTPEETQAALGELLAWIEKGEKPKPGLLTGK